MEASQARAWSTERLAREYCWTDLMGPPHCKCTWRLKPRKISPLSALCSMLQYFDPGFDSTLVVLQRCMVPLQVLNLKKEEEDKRKLEMEVEMLQHEFDRRQGDGPKLEDGHPKQSGSGLLLSTCRMATCIQYCSPHFLLQILLMKKTIKGG